MKKLRHSGHRLYCPTVKIFLLFFFHQYPLLEIKYTGCIVVYFFSSTSKFVRTHTSFALLMCSFDYWKPQNWIFVSYVRVKRMRNREKEKVKLRVNPPFAFLLLSLLILHIGSIFFSTLYFFLLLVFSEESFFFSTCSFLIYWWK